MAPDPHAHAPAPDSAAGNTDPPAGHPALSGGRLARTDVTAVVPSLDPPAAPGRSVPGELSLTGPLADHLAAVVGPVLAGSILSPTA